MTYKPKHIQRWYETINFTGENFDDYYVAAMRFFRCTPTERANFVYIGEHLSDIGATETQVIFPVFTDEVMMRRYYIMVHQDFDKGLRMADMFADRVLRKGSLDPDAEVHFDDVAVAKRWKRSSVRARLENCQEVGIDDDIAAKIAVSDGFPYGITGAELLVELYSEV